LHRFTSIGHGVHAWQSAATLERLAKEGVTLEAAHGSATPLKALQHAHVHCVLGSDDPTPMGTTFRIRSTITVCTSEHRGATERRWRREKRGQFEFVSGSAVG